MTKHFSDRRGGKSFRKKAEGGENFSKKFSKEDKPFFKRKEGDEKSFSKNDKPWEKKRDAEKKDFRSDKPWEKKKDFGKKEFRPGKPWEKKSDDRGKDATGNDFRGKRKEYGKKDFSDKKPWDKKNKKDFRDKNPCKPFRKRENENNSDEWLVFKNKDDARDFIKSNRSEKKSLGRSSEFSPREYKNENRPLKASKNFSDDSSGVRLNRFIANTGICSRREADDLITAGVVKVNGKIVTELGTKILPSDTVHYGDQLLRREKMSYVLLNKPKDYITTTDDPRERKTVMHLIESAGKERIYPVGRLDRNTTGLLLFTNDGDLAERLTHPKYGVRKIYHVSLDKNLRPEDFDKLISGIEMEDGFMKADELSFVGEGQDKKEVGIVIHSGRNRIVRRLFETLGYDVVRLDRVVYAGLTKKNLPRSGFRHLTNEEVGMLKMLVGGEKKPDNRRFYSGRSKGKRRH